eukprot:SAG31_NODE_1285_length_9002_cov_3.604852_3_plen_59_part_00
MLAQDMCKSGGSISPAVDNGDGSYSISVNIPKSDTATGILFHIIFYFIIDILISSRTY